MYLFEYFVLITNLLLFFPYRVVTIPVASDETNAVEWSKLNINSETISSVETVAASQ